MLRLSLIFALCLLLSPAPVFADEAKEGFKEVFHGMKKVTKKADKDVKKAFKPVHKKAKKDFKAIDKAAKKGLKQAGHDVKEVVK